MERQLVQITGCGTGCVSIVSWAFKAVFETNFLYFSFKMLATVSGSSSLQIHLINFWIRIRLKVPGPDSQR